VHRCILLKPLDGMSRNLAGTLVAPSHIALHCLHNVFNYRITFMGHHWDQPTTLVSRKSYHDIC